MGSKLKRMIHKPFGMPAKLSRQRRSFRQRLRGFSLVELLVVIGIITLLFAIILPTISKARESSLRIQCASNLRQCGLVEAFYANENHGWLLMRETAHSGSIASLVQPGGGFFSISLGRYCSPLIWFCPEYRDVGMPAADLMSDRSKNFLVSTLHRCGYGFFGAYWDGTKPASAGPNWGTIGAYTNSIASKQTHLKAYMVRMTEWYSDNGADWGTTGASKWHTSFNGSPQGGNILFADGSVVWSHNIMRYYGGEHYTIPDGYTNLP